MREDFSLDSIGSCFSYNGYRYLFLLRGKEPAKSYVDANFTYLYDQPPAQAHPKNLFVMVNHEFQDNSEFYKKYAEYKMQQLDSTNFGSIEVMHIDNSNLKFVGKY